MTLFPYWFNEALRPALALFWMVAGLGLPWAFAFLPRKDWRSGPLVALLAIAVGPALMTAWMFVLGTIGGASETALLTPLNIMAGTIPLALIGAGIALYKRRAAPVAERAARSPLALDERLLIIMIVAACVLRWLAAVWYPFWEYDPLWVYGYEGKLYTLLGYIPQHIGYYPQFLPLQYAYAQIMAGGVSDHAARAAFPIYHWGSILAVYALGRLNISRRVGVYAAALWALYPHVGQWATTGDLEIPLTFACTGAAVFFLAAWNSILPAASSPVPPTRAGGLNALRASLNARFAPTGPAFSYALLSGFFLGIALWTKPTGGALILGIVLMVAVEALRVRFDLRKLWPRFQVALWCGLASIPLGSVWYIRNVLLGHRAIDLPHPFWPTQAMRSGLEFGWPVLAAALLSAWLLWGPGLRFRPAIRRTLAGGLLIAAALLPSIIQPHRLGLGDWSALAAAGRWLRLSAGIAEWVLLMAGIALLFSALWPVLRHATVQAKREAAIIGWGLLLAAPYFAVWFYSYSYHYRLSFPIVPLMILPVAAVLARWIPPQVAIGSRPRIAPWVGLPLLIACLPGLIAPLYHYEGGWDYLWSNEYPDDGSRLASTNYALFRTVRILERDIAYRGLEKPVILAPGLQRLPFFFPLDDVRITETPTDLDQLRGVDYYVYTQEARWLYEENQQPEINPVTGSMYRSELMRPIGSASDPSFFGIVYRVRGPDRRFTPPAELDAPAQPVIWPFASLAGTRLDGTPVLGGDEPPRLFVTFRASGPAPLEYNIYLHLIAPDGTLITTWDSPPAAGEYGWYSTRLWDPDEYVTHIRALTLPEGVTLERGLTYTIRLGWYDLFSEGQPRVMARSADQDVNGVVLPYRLTRSP